jgi:hypothetical protein
MISHEMFPRVLRVIYSRLAHVGKPVVVADERPAAWPLDSVVGVAPSYAHHPLPNMGQGQIGPPLNLECLHTRHAVAPWQPIGSVHQF